MLQRLPIALQQAKTDKKNQKLYKMKLEKLPILCSSRKKKSNQYNYNMDAILINLGYSKTANPHRRLLFNVADKIDLRKGGKCAAHYHVLVSTILNLKYQLQHGMKYKTFANNPPYI